MLSDEIIELYKKFRLVHYRELFGNIHERDGSLSATEAFAVDVIYLLEGPTIKQLAETLGVSQPNATYKVNNLVAKGYVSKTPSEDDKRESHVTVCDKFYRYYDTDCGFIKDALEKVKTRFTPEEIKAFTDVLRCLNETVE